MSHMLNPCFCADWRGGERRPWHPFPVGAFVLMPSIHAAGPATCPEIYNGCPGVLSPCLGVTVMGRGPQSSLTPGGATGQHIQGP